MSKDLGLEGTESSILGRALENMPAIVKNVLILRLHHKLQYREIAAVLGISIETAKAHLYVGQVQLREEVKRAALETSDAREHISVSAD